MTYGSSKRFPSKLAGPQSLWPRHGPTHRALATARHALTGQPVHDLLLLLRISIRRTFVWTRAPELAITDDVLCHAMRRAAQLAENIGCAANGRRRTSHDRLPGHTRHDPAPTSDPTEVEYRLYFRPQGCPCGDYTDPRRQCNCTPAKIDHYMSKISGPLLDCIDIHIEVPAVEYRDLSADLGGQGSAEMREMVAAARNAQTARVHRAKILTNAHMSNRLVKRHCHLDGRTEAILEQAMHELALSARAYTKILKMSRTGVRQVWRRLRPSISPLPSTACHQLLTILRLWQGYWGSTETGSTGLSLRRSWRRSSIRPCLIASA